MGAGRRLVRRLFIALAGRVVRRAIGLSSREEWLSSSAIVTRREELGVLEDGDECINVGPLGGVAEADRVEGGGESIDERLDEIRTGIDDCPDTLLSGVADVGLW